MRVRATNEEGSVTGADTTVTTVAAPPPPKPVLKARANFSWAFIGSRTLLTKVEVTGLAGGETVKVTCKGKGCPFKTKTYKKLKKGKKSLTSLLRPQAQAQQGRADRGPRHQRRTRSAPRPS